jgi:hypothetical protein
MEFKLTINMDNAVFGDNEDENAVEVARVLREFVSRLEQPMVPLRGAVLMDSNGNQVGHAWVEETEPSSVYAKS